MHRRSDSVLVPKNGRELMVGIVARISGCASQDEISLDDQQDHAKEAIADLYDGPVAFHVIATEGKGERLDRPELVEVESEYRKGVYDLFVYEDLGRLVRGAEAVRLWGIGVDHGTRSIAINDCIDTADDTWEQDALTACSEHVAHNAHTSKRLKQKLMNRFKKLGGAPARPIYGYIVPPGVKNYNDWLKDERASEMIKKGAELLRTTLNGSVVAEWFNAQGVPVGPYVRTKTKWDGTMVLQFYRNTLLKGQPRRGVRHTIKHHETGRRVSVKNPKGSHAYDCPHLAHLSPVEFDELNALLNQKNAPCKRKPANGSDPRSCVPKKRTRFPGQHSRCWYCGRIYHWGGNGTKDTLMCSGSHEWQCWNSIGLSGSLIVERLTQAISSELYGLKGFDDQFRDLVQRARHNADGHLDSRWQRILHDADALAKKKEHVKSVIAAMGMQPLIRELLDDIAADEARLSIDRSEAERLRSRALVLPNSITELRALFDDSLQRLASDSPEFGQLMRRLVPRLHVYLVRFCDGGRLLPRAQVQLALDGIVPDSRQAPELGPLLTQDLTIDLFEVPQRERIREEAVALAMQGLGPKAIAARISERPTATAVQNALALQRKMEELGLETPYVTLFEPPADYSKLRRHKNNKYCFTPLEGYQRLSM